MHRLFDSVQPVMYDIDLNLSPLVSSAYQLSGTVRIKIDILEMVESITLHAAASLNVVGSVYYPPCEGGSETPEKGLTCSFHPPGRYSMVPETVSFTLPDRLPFQETNEGSPAILEIQYTVTIPDVGGKGMVHLHSVISTLGEPCMTRSYVPCFDEPMFRAYYRLKLRVPKIEGTLAVSNMPQLRPPVECDSHDAEHPNTTQYHFAMTPVRLCTYLFGMLWGKLHVTPSVPVRGYPAITVRAVVPLGTSLESCEIPVQWGAQCVELFIGMTGGHTASLGTLDLCGIPEYATLGAEVWGMIGFQLSHFAFEGPEANLQRQQRVARLVGHEVAHMWFGNDVTITWWEELYMKEGMARFLEYYACDTLRPDWHYWSHLRTDFLHYVMLDDFPWGRPIRRPCSTTKSCQDVFDTLTYTKGGTLFRALHMFMGDNALRNVFSQVFRELSGRPMSAAAFFDIVNRCTPAELSEEFGPLSDIMHAAFNTAGLPLVIVEDDFSFSKCFCEKEFGGCSIPVLMTLSARDEVAGGKFKEERLVLHSNRTEGWWKHPRKITCVVTQTCGEGYYRTQYKERPWLSLMESIASLNVTQLVTLMHDTLELRVLFPTENCPRLLSLLGAIVRQCAFNSVLWGQVAQVVLGIITHADHHASQLTSCEVLFKTVLEPMMLRAVNDCLRLSRLPCGVQGNHESISEYDSDKHLDLASATAICRLLCYVSNPFRCDSLDNAIHTLAQVFWSNDFNLSIAHEQIISVVVAAMVRDPFADVQTVLQTLDDTHRAFHLQNNVGVTKGIANGMFMLNRHEYNFLWMKNAFVWAKDVEADVCLLNRSLMVELKSKGVRGLGRGLNSHPHVLSFDESWSRDYGRLFFVD